MATYSSFTWPSEETRTRPCDPGHERLACHRVGVGDLVNICYAYGL